MEVHVYITGIDHPAEHQARLEQKQTEDDSISLWFSGVPLHTFQLRWNRQNKRLVYGK